MQAAALGALEFDRIREALAHEALTPLGRTRALALSPATDAAEVAAGLDLAIEAAAFVAAGGSLGLFAPEHLAETILALEIGDTALDPLALLGLARFVTSVDDVVAGVRRADGATPPTDLGRLASRAPSFADEARAIDRAIEPGGDVRDDATPALRDVRDALRRHRAKLRATLDTVVRGRDTAKYLQDQIVTDRHGRYVVVVRAEHRDAVPGIVHGTSASGASLYLEPIATVGLNNEIVELAEREREEVLRILLSLTDAFRRRHEDLEALLDAAGEIDELHAKTALARRWDGVAPALSTDGAIELLGARHPLLLLQSQSVVASDLRLLPHARALVISGPNTGGKTVALKAFGLLALMAQAGLLIPVERGSRLTPLRSVFADIGDEQSISASLSTFSGRVAALVAIERTLELPGLILLDEVGSGTDPAEGGALGTAVVDHFRRRGALVVATTHDDVLKSYAATTEGVVTASFGFDPATYAPTYRLLYGAPGRSLAFEVAERLGMPASVIADARARRSGRESQLAEHLARIDRQMAALDADRAGVAGERDGLAAERQRLLEREGRLAEREAVLKKRLDDKVNEKLREARVEVDRVVGQLKRRADALAERVEHAPRAAVTTGDVGHLRADARSALSSIGERLAPDAETEDAGKLDGPPKVGQRVLVTAFGAEGLVRDVSGRDVDVEIRGKRMRVKIDGLRRAGSEESGGSGGSAKSVRSASAPGPGLPVATRELVVIGSTVDDARDRAEKFLDQALLNDERRLRVVHGHGTGRLRDALRAFFREHPLVENVTPAAANEGGDGATIVELKE